MISFDAFIKALQDAILGANDALMDKNLELLDRFFEETPEHTHEAASAETPPGAEPASAPEGLDLSKAPQDPHEPHVSHVPQSVCIIYPRQTSTGVEEIAIHVPLITLVPLSMSQIEQVKVKADFEIHMADGELQLNFPTGTEKKGGVLSRKSRKRKTTTGNLEITITPHPVSEGLKIVVEGYERALRAQIPH